MRLVRRRSLYNRFDELYGILSLQYSRSWEKMPYASVSVSHNRGRSMMKINQIYTIIRSPTIVSIRDWMESNLLLNHILRSDWSDFGDCDVSIRSTGVCILNMSTLIIVLTTMMTAMKIHCQEGPKPHTRENEL